MEWMVWEEELAGRLSGASVDSSHYICLVMPAALRQRRIGRKSWCVHRLFHFGLLFTICRFRLKIGALRSVKLGMLLHGFKLSLSIRLRFVFKLRLCAEESAMRM